MDNLTTQVGIPGTAGVLGVILSFFGLKSRIKNLESSIPDCPVEREKVLKRVDEKIAASIALVNQQLAAGAKEFKRHTDEITAMNVVVTQTSNQIIRLVTIMERNGFNGKWDGKDRRKNGNQRGC